MKLIKTKKQLARAVFQGDIVQTWESEGPCPRYCKSSATMFLVNGEEHLVFASLEKIQNELRSDKRLKQHPVLGLRTMKETKTKENGKTMFRCSLGDCHGSVFSDDPRNMIS